MHSISDVILTHSLVQLTLAVLVFKQYTLHLAIIIRNQNVVQLSSYEHPLL